MRALALLTWTELKLLSREPISLALAFAFPVIVLFVMGETFGRQPNAAFGGATGVDYYVPAYVGMVVMALTFFAIPAHLALYRERGVLRRLRASGVPGWGMVVSQTAVALALSLAGTLLLVAFTWLVYGLQPPRLPSAVVLAFVLSALAMAQVGVLLGSILPGVRTAQGVGLVLFFLMMLLSGAGPPTGAMSSTMKIIAEALPLTHVIRALQDGWLWSTWGGNELVIVAAFGLAAALLGTRWFRWD